MTSRLMVLFGALALAATLLAVPAHADNLGQTVSGLGSASVGHAATASTVSTAATAAAGDTEKWHPVSGALFNNPYVEANRFTLESYLVHAIRNTPKGESIHISVYSFDRRNVMKALIAAKRRGVQVQILLNDHQYTREQRIMHTAIGRSRKRKNFSYECKASCRGRRDNLHSKFFLFSKTGGVEHVVMLGSVNFTLNAVKWQWNDLLTMNDRPDLYKHFLDLFRDMKVDYSSNQPYMLFCDKPAHHACHSETDKKYTRVFPRNSSPRNDPVLNILEPIKCIYQTQDGDTKRTILRLSMHTMRGDRGKYIGQRVRQLWAEGCDVRVIYGIMGSGVKRGMGAPTARGRIPLRSAGFDYDGDGEVNRYTHQKYFLIQGRWAGRTTAMTFTGSSNWTARGTYGDEIMFNIESAKVRNQYARNFNLMWNSSRYTRNAYTTTSYSGPPITDVTPRPDGTPVHTVYRPTLTKQVNRPDRIRGGGVTWESD